MRRTAVLLPGHQNHGPRCSEITTPSRGPSADPCDFGVRRQDTPLVVTSRSFVGRSSHGSNRGVHRGTMKNRMEAKYKTIVQAAVIVVVVAIIAIV